MSERRYYENQHGVLCVETICEVCGRTFCIIPAPKVVENWPACLAPDCASYDPERDVGALLEDGAEIAVVPSRNEPRA